MGHDRQGRRGLMLTPCSRFLATSGLPGRTARRVLASLLDFGVLKSDSCLGPVYFPIPFDSLRWLFPRLWPEAESREP